MAIRVERVVTYTGEIDFKKKYLIGKVDEEFKENVYRDILSEFLKEMQSDGIVFDSNTGEVVEHTLDEFISDPDDENDEEDEEVVQLEKIEGYPTTEQLMALYTRGLSIKDIEPLVEPQFWGGARTRIYEYIREYPQFDHQPKRKKRTHITDEVKDTFAALYNLGKSKEEIVNALDISLSSYSRVRSELIAGGKIHD